MGRHSGMSVAPDLFTKADAGIVVGLSGESLKSMPAAAALLDASASDVVGHIHLPGRGAGAELMKGAESIANEDLGRRLLSTAESAARGDLEGMASLSLAVDDDKSAAVADEQLGRMLKSLKEQAKASGKTVVVHLVAEDEGRRRLQDEDEEGQEGQNQNNNNNNNASYGEKTMYEIQTFNLYLWTSVGLVTVVFMVMSAFVNMPLMPDTLLFGETAKIAGSD